MFSSSTFTFSMGSGERKRCSNMAPVRRLRSFAWMKARRLPGVRCSTLKTECKSLLCLMIMPGGSWVAEIAILGLLFFTLCQEFWCWVEVAVASAALGVNSFILHRPRGLWEPGRYCVCGHLLRSEEH